MKDKLSVKVREMLGTRNSQRVRRAGLIPAVLYGHGEATISLSVPKDEVIAVVRHGGRLVDLSGDVTETALIRHVQWDAFGIDIIHIDLGRVSADETVDITLPIEMKGASPGSKEGGLVELVKHEIKIRCPVLSIPEKLIINITGLHLDQSLESKDITLPEGASLLTDPEEVVVHCVTPKTEEELIAGDAVSEPEVITRKKEEGAEEAE